MRKKLKTIWKSFEKKEWILLMIVILLAGLCSGTVAYIVRYSILENTFDVGKVIADIQETFENGQITKRNVSIQNTGNIDAYVRVKILMYFKDKEGKISTQVPVEGINYDIEMEASANWFLKDGCYYYSEPVVANGSTSELIKTCTVLSVPENQTFYMDVIVQAIQATKTAVEDAWPSITVQDNKSIQAKQEVTP